MTPRVREILSWYESENTGTRTNLARLLGHGRLGGSGRLVILPVDQGFEHGPARSFAPNPAAYDPRYHFELAIEAGLSAHTAPLGALEAAASEYAGDIPLILKVNGHDFLRRDRDPFPALTASIDDALRLGCTAVGFTIYPGSAASREMYEQCRRVAEEAKRAGLPVVVWSYPRGGELSRAGETAIDVVAYAAHIAVQLGADIVKVKLPTAHVEQPEVREIYERDGIPIDALVDRVRHVVQSAFDGRRLVIFSGGPSTGDESLLEQARAIRDGGGSGSIIGRNSFQRSRAHAIDLLRAIMDVYGEDALWPASALSDAGGRTEATGKA